MDFDPTDATDWLYLGLSFLGVIVFGFLTSLAFGYSRFKGRGRGDFLYYVREGWPLIGHTVEAHCWAEKEKLGWKVELRVPLAAPLPRKFELTMTRGYDEQFEPLDLEEDFEWVFPAGHGRLPGTEWLQRPGVREQLLAVWKKTPLPRALKVAGRLARASISKTDDFGHPDVVKMEHALQEIVRIVNAA